MAEIDKDTVLKIANLARLRLSETEVDLFQAKLAKVLEHVKDLEQVPTEDSSSVTHIPSDAVLARDDKVTEFKNVGGLLENAPKRSENAFVLPPVME